MQTKTTYVGLAAALVAAVFFGVTQFRQDDAAPAKLRDDPNLFSFVRSMEGSVPDGEIKADGDALVVDTELRLLYDYFLTAVGEKTVDEIRAEIEREIDKRLKSAPAAEAKRLLARYLDYKRALVDVEKNAQLAGPSLAAMRARIEAMHRTRAKFFSGREAEGLFGADDAYDADALARLEVLQDKSLTDAQKKEKIAALDAALPAEVREAKEAPLRIVRLEESVSKMRAQGASDDEVYRTRAAALNPEAAARLAEVDREEQEWKSRIAGYLAERSRLLQDGGRLPEAERQAALQQLRQARFTPQEQLRLPAYE